MTQDISKANGRITQKQRSHIGLMWGDTVGIESKRIGVELGKFCSYGFLSEITMGALTRRAA
jgi:hypothetical protein